MGMKQMHLPTLEIPHKRCPNCGINKPWSAYSSQNLKVFRPCSYCRKCQRAYCKAHYRRNRELHNTGRYQRAKRERRQKREYIWNFLDTHPCIDCGEADSVVLEFDHVTGKKDRDVSVLVATNASQEQLEREVAKCVVR